MCFPGGKQEENETPEETAIRETIEEMGIDGNAIEIWGKIFSELIKTHIAEFFYDMSNRYQKIWSSKTSIFRPLTPGCHSTFDIVRHSDRRLHSKRRLLEAVESQSS